MIIKKVVTLMLTLCIISTTVPIAKAVETTEIIERTRYVTAGEVALITGHMLNTVTDVKFYRVPDSGADPQNFRFVRQPVSTNFVQHETNTKSTNATFVENDAISGDILQKADNNIKVQVADMDFGIFATRVYNSSSAIESFYFNIPSAEWALGDMGTAKCTPGSRLRIQGKNLSFNQKQVTVIMENSQTGDQTVLEVPDTYGKYSIEAVIPDAASLGDYKLYVHNGYGDNTCWSEPLDIKITEGINWPKTIFNVRDYGAAGDMQQDDTAAFRLAMAAARDNNGGVVYVPKGTYVLSNGFVLPENVELRGENNMVSQILFDTSRYDNKEVPEVMIEATDNFAICDLYIWGIRLKTLLSNFDRDSYTFEQYNNIFLENLVIRSHVWMGKVDINNHKYDAMRELTSEGDNFESYDLIKLSGNNIKMKNNDIITNSGIGAISGGNGVMLQKNTISSISSAVGWSMQGISNIIVEQNEIVDGQISYGAWNIRLVNENVYHARNFYRHNFGNDRETLTTDGQKQAYSATQTKVSDNSIVFPRQLTYGEVGGMKAFIGSMVAVVSGKGAGQARTLTAYDDATNTGTLSSPFRIVPDENSVVQLISKFNNIVITENDFNESNCLATYAMGYDWTIDNNSFKRTFGVYLKAYSVYSASGQIQYFDILDNSFAGGANYIHWNGPMEKGYLSGDFAVTFGANNRIQFVNVRRNTIDDCGNINLMTNYNTSRIEGVIIQQNKLNNLNNGIIFNAFNNNSFSGIVLKGNQYNNVSEIYSLKNCAFGDIIKNLDEAQ